jgi:hypothetical protein
MRQISLHQKPRGGTPAECAAHVLHSDQTPRGRSLAASIPLILCAWLLALSLGCSTNVTQSNFDRIQIGMTQAEVEAFLGKPHTHYQNILSWKTNHEKTVITVVIDDQGKVESKNAEGL